MSAVSYKTMEELEKEGLKTNATYLMVDLLNEGLASVSESFGLQFFVQENVLELSNHPIEDSGRDL